MCARYTIKVPGTKLVVHFKAKNREFAFDAFPEIAPTMKAPIVVRDTGENILKIMKWGLIPSWAKDPKIGVQCFNARAETVAEKPAFRSAFKSKRCLVPINCFYEWRDEANESEPVKKKKKKTKYRFENQQEPIFTLAGLWSAWQPPEGETIETFTVLTTSPNDFMSSYHNRMPVILTREQEDLWLDPAFPVEALHNLTKPAVNDLLSVDRCDS